MRSSRVKGRKRKKKKEREEELKEVPSPRLYLGWKKRFVDRRAPIFSLSSCDRIDRLLD